MWQINRAYEVIAAMALLTTAVFAQKPDLHGGGAEPSEIANHRTTQVTLPGHYLAGATLTVDGACQLEDYTAAANQIVMTVTGNRATSDHDGYCNLHVKTAAGKVSTWIIVDLTEDEAAQKNATDKSAERLKAAQFMARSGSQWTLHFADGGTITYKLKQDSDPAVTTFTDDAGNEAKIMVANDSTVMIVPSEGGCYRTGKLAGGRVANGTSAGSCKPGGNWTAEMR